MLDRLFKEKEVDMGHISGQMVIAMLGHSSMAQ